MDKDSSNFQAPRNVVARSLVEEISATRKSASGQRNAEARRCTKAEKIYCIDPEDKESMNKCARKSWNYVRFLRSHADFRKISGEILPKGA